MKKFYVTTSIAYVNAPPHIGFALESIQGDVLARYHRSLLKEDVFYLTGTDEHGSKIAKAAEDAGETPREFVDDISRKFKELKDLLNLSNDDFIRTSDSKRHWPSVEKVWNMLKENGDIYMKEYKGLYCSGCEAFITRKDLIDGKCSIHKKEPEVINEENYFFRLSKYTDQIKELLESGKLKIIPETRRNELLSFTKEGLEDVSFSRPSKDLSWGVPVPGDDSQTIYVWADALINYISALGFAEDDEKYKKYWPADVHCIGKDILRFHGLIWPGILLSLGLLLPEKILVHGFINVGGQKMSKSLGNVIDPFELVKKYGVDAVRYYLLREIASTEDGDFTYDKFEGRYNSDLAGGIGNLLARVRTMAEKVKIQFHSSLSGINDKVENTINPEFAKKIEEIKKEYVKTLDEFKFNETLKVVWSLISYCDKYIEEKKPWKGGERSAEVLSDLVYTLNWIAVLLVPFLPETSGEILHRLEEGKEGFENEKGDSLFPRVS